MGWMTDRDEMRMRMMMDGWMDTMDRMTTSLHDTYDMSIQHTVARIVWKTQQHDI